MSELRTPGSDTSAVAVAAAAGGTCVGTAAEASLSSLSGIGAEWIGDIRVSSLRKHSLQRIQTSTRSRRDTTGTITAMSKIGVLFLFAQYLSLTFEHMGLPSSLICHYTSY
uniref:Uncharacterized protein n=1 Tax=Oryza rufipogon TaxID=4529 RepID=A0A0E0N3X2_ORYRU